MFRVAIEMLLYDKMKFLGLLIGVTFTAFLVTFAMGYFAGFMTRGFALVDDNPTAKVWVMDPAVSSTEATINMSNASLDMVRGIEGVEYATPLYLGDVTARYANGHFQSFQIIGVDDTTLSGAPQGIANLLHIPNSVIVDSGGTEGKLLTPLYKKDMWSYDGSHLNAPTREFRFGDTMLINSKRVVVAGISHTIPRFPPRPLLYTTISNFKRLIPGERRYITFIMVRPAKNITPTELAQRITQKTHLKAITDDEFKKETVLWFMINSEDVGDMVNMVILAMLVGFGVTGVMLYMFTYENIKQYAILKAIGASSKQLRDMIFTQVIVSSVAGSGIGVGIAAVLAQLISSPTFPFRMMWFAPLIGFLGVMIVSFSAIFMSLRPLKNMEAGIVFKL
ncbi:protein of unknown function DUF214 [hydrothermal vent metagenome]|uniref:ABC3 transporter permease C-terminal domain-containing protein n=1 Tax=hydrothermal vent metagenome TaxID=652676 RepID=A0A1W1D2M5_9ZZZZ